MRNRLGLRQREPTWTVARRRQVAVGNGMDCATKEASGGGGGSRNQCGRRRQRVVAVGTGVDCNTGGGLNPEAKGPTKSQAAASCVSGPVQEDKVFGVGPASWGLPPGPCLLGPAPCLLVPASKALPPASWALPPRYCFLPWPC
ncbi:hypothetical protein EYF80_015362 [Liparis tanakae]|uniref:Uncharacterized protein n=1 Tax=Liparis tanakae TaxID=230148 RepID=A0A4Z2IBC3_9TELE|nr:hypothetical protein EYF80_015362 [Liparis tanakae]